MFGNVRSGKSGEGASAGSRVPHGAGPDGGFAPDRAAPASPRRGLTVARNAGGRGRPGQW